jgi:hypothetical protein
VSREPDPERELGVSRAIDRAHAACDNRTLCHSGYPNSGTTGMLVKDYRGKNAEQEIWKFDAALVEKFANVLKQAPSKKASGPRSARRPAA